MPAAHLRHRSLYAWMLLNIVLIILAVISLASFGVLSETKAKSLDASILREQDLVGGLYGGVSATQDKLESYIKLPDARTLDSFRASREELLAGLDEFLRISRGEKEERVVTDYGFMVRSYLEEAENTARFRREGKLPDALVSHEKAMSMKELLNRQLPALFSVMEGDSMLRRQRADRIRLQNLLIDIALSVVVCGLAVAFLLQSLKRVIRPIENLTEAASRINQGDLSVRLLGNSPDCEIRDLSRAFNAMLDTIDRQISELEEAARLKALLHDSELKNQKAEFLVREAELQAMQARINPHFLFNTLNMICQSAYSERAIKSAGMTESLAAMLHYIMVNSTKPVSIGDEIHYTKDYFQIQNLRFGGRILFSIECPRELEAYQVPRLLVQPLVENAVQHGVKNIVGNASVSAIVAQVEGSISISVSDTGSGISEVELESITRRMASESAPDGSIGLYNVYQRLRLFFGEKAGLDIRSAPGLGTTVVMRFPAILAGQS
jgi:two-component system, sensor histidine kinase YesM